MRILVITRNAWDDSNSIGNTISNFFQGLPDIEFANIYFRSANPNNKLCQKYYQVTEIDILKHWFVPSRIGRSFEIDKQFDKTEKKEAVEKREKNIISFIHRFGFKLIYCFSDFLWNSCRWINDDLQKFIESFAPDLIFTFVKAAPQYYQTISFLRKKYQIPLMTFIADDEYSGYLMHNQKRKIDNLKYILSESSVVTGCSEEICTYYNSLFNCNATPLYKGCELILPSKEHSNDSLTIVYAGNLLCGRLDIIQKISDLIEDYSFNNNKKINFEIYSNTHLSSIEVSRLSDNKKCTFFMGRKPYEDIKKRLSGSNLVLFAESFIKSEIIKTKYSFSTKIIDYLQSGSAIVSVGPSEIASIKYLKRIPGVFVIDNLDSLKSELTYVLDNNQNYNKRAEQIFLFAKEKHDPIKLKNELRMLLSQAVDC